jgi:hypothetical protein
VRRLALSRLVICASPSYLKKCGMPREPDELAKHNCLCTGLLPWGDEWRLAGRRGEVGLGCAVACALPYLPLPRHPEDFARPADDSPETRSVTPDTSLPSGGLSTKNVIGDIRTPKRHLSRRTHLQATVMPSVGT